MKILSLCRRGNVRSVALAYYLKDGLGLKDVIISGVDILTPSGWEGIGQWADRIYVVGEKELLEGVPPKFQHKVRHLNIGVDVWSDPTHPDLLNTIKDVMAARGEDRKEYFEY